MNARRVLVLVLVLMLVMLMMLLLQVLMVLRLELLEERELRLLRADRGRGRVGEEWVRERVARRDAVPRIESEQALQKIQAVQGLGGA